MRTIVIALVALGLFQAVCFAQPAVGDKPNLAFKAYDGTPVDLAKLRGKMVLIDFWASWCGPCMAEADHLVRISREWGPKAWCCSASIWTGTPPPC